MRSRNPIDDWCTGALIGYIFSRPRKDRQLIGNKWLPQRAKKAHSARAKLWANRTYQSLNRGRLVL